MDSVKSPSRRAADAAHRRSRRILRAASSVLRVCAVTAALCLVYAQTPLARPHSLGVGARLLLWLTVLALIVLWEIRAILRSRHPWLRAAESAAISVPLLLLPFAAAYAATAEADAASFTQPLTRVDAVYFAVTVFATVGFGDVAPVSEPARVLVTVQMLADLLLIGVIVKVLVGAAQRRRHVLNVGDNGPVSGPAAGGGADRGNEAAQTALRDGSHHDP